MKTPNKLDNPDLGGGSFAMVIARMGASNTCQL